MSSTDSHTIPRRGKGDFFNEEMKKHIAALGPAWIDLPEKRRNSERSMWFSKHFEQFRQKYEHLFHKDDRILLESRFRQKLDNLKRTSRATDKHKDKAKSKEETRLASLALWVQDEEVRPKSALELFEDENKAEIMAKVAQERHTTQDNLPLFSSWRSAMWKALTGEQQEAYISRAELMAREAEERRAQPLTKEKKSENRVSFHAALTNSIQDAIPRLVGNARAVTFVVYEDGDSAVLESVTPGFSQTDAFQEGNVGDTFSKLLWTWARQNMQDREDPVDSSEKSMDGSRAVVDKSVAPRRAVASGSDQPMSSAPVNNFDDFATTSANDSTPPSQLNVNDTSRNEEFDPVLSTTASSTVSLEVEARPTTQKRKWVPSLCIPGSAESVGCHSRSRARSILVNERETPANTKDIDNDGSEVSDGDEETKVDEGNDNDGNEEPRGKTTRTTAKEDAPVRRSSRVANGNAKNDKTSDSNEDDEDDDDDDDERDVEEPQSKRRKTRSSTAKMPDPIRRSSRGTKGDTLVQGKLGMRGDYAGKRGGRGGSRIGQGRKRGGRT